MGRQERHRKVLGPLLRAGLEVIPDAVPASAIPHVLGYEQERILGGFLVAYEDPRLVERLNEGWYDLAMSTGLLDENREFLLMLPRGTWTAAEDRRRRMTHTWHRVRLLDRWDIMGAGANSFLGIHAGHPGFAMLALDNSVWLIADTYESGVGVYAVRDPALSPGVLRDLEWLAREDIYKDREFRREVTAWLERRQQR
ncbi:hypothetical protein OH786_00975 [Streptomyces atratus]|uniref:Uncharacterized protein n=1 Tax=Streptomyces atratus TaxID=1893 RepID=A0A1K1YJR8_STRAR|nr:hypothetical protein [Streptomyces atratus]SFX61659.1 hypothetical protein SAMN02787144_1004314 [Streptomyces atratus]